MRRARPWPAGVDGSGRRRQPKLQQGVADRGSGGWSFDRAGEAAEGGAWEGSRGRGREQGERACVQQQSRPRPTGGHARRRGRTRTEGRCGEHGDYGDDSSWKIEGWGGTTAHSALDDGVAGSGLRSWWRFVDDEVEATADDGDR